MRVHLKCHRTLFSIDSKSRFRHACYVYDPSSSFNTVSNGFKEVVDLFQGFELYFILPDDEVKNICGWSCPPAARCQNRQKMMWNWLERCKSQMLNQSNKIRIICSQFECLSLIFCFVQGPTLPYLYHG